MSSLKSWLNKLDSREKSECITASSAEIKEVKKSMNGKRGIIIKNEHPNRVERKLAQKPELKSPVKNNRATSKARKNNRLFIKMSEFYMSVRNKQLKLS